MRGLRQMVLLRGGLETFRSNRVLYNMILRYASPTIVPAHRTRLMSCSTDLCGSIDAERKPFFDDIGVPAVMTQIQCTYTSEGFYEINSLAPFSDEFIQILRRIENSTDALNVLRGGSTLTPLDLRDELTSIQYALLRIESSRHDLNESKVQHICRQGLLLYSATILNGLPSTASNFDMLGANLVVALQDTFGENRITQGLRLWLALLITTIVCDETSKSWARREFATIFQSSFAHKQEHAKAQLERFFWVDRIHGPRLDELWKKALGNSESQSVRAVKRSKEKCDDAFSLSL
jgi:hypothetical protein